jgi:hypothetical protein
MAHIHYDGPCDTRTCPAIVEEGHRIGVFKLVTARKAALKTVCLHIPNHEM